MGKLRRLLRIEYRYRKGARLRIGHKGNKKQWKRRKEHLGDYNRKGRYLEEKNPENVQAILVVGDYEGEEFDIVGKMVITKDEYSRFGSNHELQRLMVKYAVNNLIENRQGGMAAMIGKEGNNVGIEVELTNMPKDDFHFTRFMVRGVDMLYEMTHRRKSSYQKRMDGTNDEVVDFNDDA